jgi:hypothetical protein
MMRARSTSISVLLLLVATVPALAQTPGAPQITVLPDRSVVLTYAAPITPPAQTVLVATHNGLPIGPFAIGASTSVTSGPLAPGTYSVQVVWNNNVASPVTTFVVGHSTPGAPPGPTAMLSPVVTNGAVVLAWNPIAGVSSYELEATSASTRQVFRLAVTRNDLQGPGALLAVGIVIHGAPPDTYIIRVRGINAYGAGPFSAAVTLRVTPI